MEFAPFECFLVLVGTLISLSTLYDVVCSKSSKLKELSTIFSLYTNGKNLFNLESSQNSISCIHGIKTISMLFIVFHHSYQILFNSVSSLRFQNEYAHMKHRSLLMTILATDSFFVLSGFLSVNCFLKKDTTICRYMKVLIQRYMRLIPTAAFLIVILISIKDFHGLDGYIVSQNGDCKQLWWTSMLLIQTYYNPNNTCIGPLWFTANCWHVFVITPIIIKLLKSSNRLIRALLMAAILISTFIPGYRASLGSKAVLELYTDTITRSYPYIFGVLYYHEFFKTKELPRPLKALFWIIALSIILAPYKYLSTPNEPIDKLTENFAYIRIFWPFGICWIIHACHYGWGGIINSFLSFKYFIPFSNICLGLYIMNDYTAHYISSYVINHTEGMRFPMDRIYLMFLSTYAIATVIAAVLYLCIEVPFSSLAKVATESSCYSSSIKKVYDLSKQKLGIHYVKFSKKSDSVEKNSVC